MGHLTFNNAYLKFYVAEIDKIDKMEYSVSIYIFDRTFQMFWLFIVLYGKNGF